MSGNKPTVAFTSQFSKRAAALDRVAYCPYPHSSSTCKQVVWMVIDELLVGQTALENDDVRRYLDENAHDTEVTVFEGFTHKPAEDVAIWRLNRTPGVSANPDVAEAVWAMRSYLPFHIKGQVAPNHVLIPAPDFHACPWGSPADNGDEREIGAEEDGGPKITVIDSGYMRSGPIESESRLREVVTGEWFTADPQGDAGYTWAKEPDQTLKAPDNFDQDHDGKLDALAGHANFVAGVVAQGCRNAVIRVVSHDGAFIERTALADTPVPTEASVARSMWRAQGAREAENETDQPMPQADVINVGFAFPTLPSDDLSRNPVGDGPPSWTLQLVLDSTDTEKHVFVAPAGNQGCTTQHYPAAFPAVIGVGSSRYAEISVFSNRGPWVSFYSDGEAVNSTFIKGWEGYTEESEPPDTPDGVWREKDFNSGWATWSGTSFAAPQITALIATAFAKNPGVTPRAAWEAVKNLYDETRLAPRARIRRP